MIASIYKIMLPEDLRTIVQTARDCSILKGTIVKLSIFPASKVQCSQVTSCTIKRRCRIIYMLWPKDTCPKFHLHLLCKEIVTISDANSTFIYCAKK